MVVPMKWWRWFGGMIVVGLLAGGVLSWLRPQLPPPPRPEPWFEDVTEKLGLDFRHDAGPTGTFFMPQIVGSGAALFDFDNDGLLDVYLLQNNGPGSSS